MFQEAVTKKYIEKGADPAKINIGIPLYGRGFTLADPNNSGMHASTSGPSQMGNLVPEAGILGYDEICLNRWPETQTVQGPYAVSGNQWVGYDTAESIKTKVRSLFPLSRRRIIILFLFYRWTTCELWESQITW